MRAAQVLLTASDIAARTHYLNARQTMRRLLAWRVVPVVNENDTTATDEITFGDNDFLSAQVAIMLEARLLVLLTDRPGCTRPTRAPTRTRSWSRRSTDFVRARRLRDRRADLALRPRRDAQQGGGGRDGGASGIPAVICDGTADGTLLARRRGRARRDALRSRTRSAPPSFKLWLRYAKPSHGALRSSTRARRGCCASAAAACSRSAITGVEGEFEAGDASRSSATAR